MWTPAAELTCEQNKQSFILSSWTHRLLDTTQHLSFKAHIYDFIASSLQKATFELKPSFFIKDKTFGRFQMLHFDQYIYNRQFRQ